MSVDRNCPPPCWNSLSFAHQTKQQNSWTWGCRIVIIFCFWINTTRITLPVHSHTSLTNQTITYFYGNVFFVCLCFRHFGLLKKRYTELLSHLRALVNGLHHFTSLHSRTWTRYGGHSAASRGTGHPGASAVVARVLQRRIIVAIREH